MSRLAVQDEKTTLAKGQLIGSIIVWIALTAFRREIC
jgi:hypothetical protein